jgi:hypothetical protein
MKHQSNLLALLAVTLACSLLPSAHAAGKSTTPDTSTSPSNRPAGGGGGGGKSTTPTTPTTPPVLSSGIVNYTASGPVNGSTPVCTGDYRIGAYYPTLLDMSVNVSVSSLNVPDGTVLYVNPVATAGGLLYAYTPNTIVITGGAGLCTEKLFVGVGVGLAGVTITDASGTIIFAGN